MTIQQYLDKINTLYKTGNAREDSYRGDLQNLIMAILPDVRVTNEPERVDCGAPSDMRMVNITDFKKFRYNEEVDLIFRLPILETKSPLLNNYF
jgi:hypothetical protein